MASKNYTESQLTKALLLVLEQGMSPKDAAKMTGISKRTIQRYKRRHVEDETPEPVRTTEIAVAGTTMLSSKEAMDEVDDALMRRTKFLSDVMETKQVVIDRIRKLAKKSSNLDALQRTIKTLDDLETKVDPDGGGSKLPLGNPNLNIFNFFNQKLTNEGYEGPKLEDADIVKGD
jgi:transposase